MPIHTRMLLGVLVGAVLGALGHAVGAGTPWMDVALAIAKPVGQIFLRLLFLLVIPLVFASLALGVAELGDLRKVGRLALKTLGFTLLFSSVAVILGIVLVHVVGPGEGVSPEARAALLAEASQRASTIAKPTAGIDLLIQMVPNNVFKAAAEGDMLAIIFASILLGIGLSIVRTPHTARLMEVLQGVLDVSMGLLTIVIRLAPFGVGALLFVLAATTGWTVMLQLGAYVLTVLVGLAIQLLVVYSIAVSAFAGMTPRRFFSGIQEAMLTAFSTASSAATLPTSLKVADRMGLPQATSRFVLTVGATANQNGTALFEGVTVLFLAQFYGVELSVGQEVGVVLLCILGGVGTAGVPAGSIPVVALILGMFGIPVEGVGLVLGVDRLLDMCRTALNVSGDLAIAVAVGGRETAE